MNQQDRHVDAHAPPSDAVDDKKPQSRRHPLADEQEDVAIADIHEIQALR
jgi:hypothetical protein